MDSNSRKKLRLGDALIENGVITSQQLTQALEKQQGTGKKLGEVLVERGFATENAIAQALAKQMKLELVELQNVSVDTSVLALIPVSILKKNVMFPFAFAADNPNVLRVAMADPMDMNAQDDIVFITNYQVEPVVTTTRSIMLAIDKYYGQEEVAEALAAYAKEKKLGVEEEIIAEENVNSSPVVTLVREMIEKAVRQRSSDIHVEPMAE